MKRAVLASAALLFAGSLIAATAKPAAATSTATADSPLVAAAKKSNRAGKKRLVITNESLKDSKGHLSTTAIQKSINVPEPSKSSEQIMDETRTRDKERAIERSKLAREAADAKQKSVARSVAAAEDDGPYQTDPATVEHQLDQQTSGSSAPKSAPSTPPPSSKQ